MNVVPLDAVGQPGTVRLSDIYKPWPKQNLFHALTAKYRLQVGGFGSGKSRPLLWEGVFHALEYPGSESIILRTTMPDLKRTVISKFKSDIPETLYDYYHETDHIVYFKPEPKRDYASGAILYGPDNRPLTVASKLYFGACEREEDVGKYLSTEFVFIGWEELAEFGFGIWHAMGERNRCTIPGSRACMAAATNPRGVGWSWIKKLFVDKKPFTGMDPEKYQPEDYAYVHSTVDDNPIYSRDVEYLRVLESSPLRDVVRWGKLDVVSGQYFDNWDTRHVQPDSAFLFEPWQETWVGWDYGFGHYACITFHTKAVLKANKRFGWLAPKMVNVTVRELVLHEKTPKEQAEALILSIPRHRESGAYLENVAAVYFSWERFNRTVGQFTVADEVGDLLSAAGLPRPQRSSTDRVAGWTKMYSLLDQDEWFVLDNCVTLQESIPQLVRHPVNMEDVVKPRGAVLSDDMGDSARYGIAGHLIDPEDKPEEVKLREKLAKIEDPLRRHTEAYKAWVAKQHEGQRGNKPKSEPSWMRRVRT